MSIGNLLIRADATVATGTGHVMRCLALAQAWQDAGGKAVFAMAKATAALRERLTAESCGVVTLSAPAGSPQDAAQVTAIAASEYCEWIVVDGYGFDASYQHALKAAGRRILFIDDYGHAGHYAANVVLNQNVNAREELYADREPRTRLLLGTRYCLLRRDFAGGGNSERETPPVARRLLVMMGGSDPENITARAIEALQVAGIENLDTTVVVGGSNPNFEALQGLTSRASRVTVRRDVSNMAELMAKADVAISAAGSTSWELCLMGVPALLIDVADNQTEVARELDRRQCAVRIGDRTVTAGAIATQLKRLADCQSLRQSLSQRARELVDGRGAVRVVSALRGIQAFRLRRGHADDIRLLWEWANDPEVRTASFSSAPIPWETHVRWFGEKFGEGKSLFLIAEDEEGVPFGQVRFDLNGGDAELSISVARGKRGLGLAVPLIDAAVREMLMDDRCGRVHAFVKPENAASAKAFERAGFEQVGLEQVRGSTALHFIRSRD